MSHQVPHADPERDALSGYASADLLNPAPRAEHETPPSPEQDPATGYASADLLKPGAADIRRPPRHGVPHPDPVQDPVAGYASADELGQSEPPAA